MNALEAAEENFALELVTCAEGERALLYVYQGGNHLRTARGRAETLREFAREHYAGAALNELVLVAEGGSQKPEVGSQ